MEHPSGRQFVLTHHAHEAIVTEVGGGLRSYRVGEVDVLDGFEVTAMCDGARGQALLPWPNRVADGRYSWQGTNHQLPLTEPDRHNAIHGLTRWANWELLELTASGVHLRHRLPTQPGWPFLLRCDLEYTLSGDGLSVRTTLTNVGSEPCPAAAGAHPYLSAGAGLLDTCTLQVPADTFLPTDERGIPVSRRQVEGTEHDFREARLIGGLQLDEAYGDLHRDSKGHAVVRLQRADGSTVELWAGVGYPYLEIFTGDTLTPERRRRGLAVEPMTAPPNALQTGQDLMVLDPQQSLTLQWGVRLG